MSLGPICPGFVKAFAIATLLLALPAPAIAAEPKPKAGTANCDRPQTDVHTSDKVCRRGLTPPSLWWVREQLGSQLGKKLISNWVATPATAAEPGRVVVMVNPQAWSLLDYFSRYEFLHSFGMAAHGFGYKTEVQDNRGKRLASYACSTSSPNQTSQALKEQPPKTQAETLQSQKNQTKTPCKIQFMTAGSGFRGGSRSLF